MHVWNRRLLTDSFHHLRMMCVGDHRQHSLFYKSFVYV